MGSFEDSVKKAFEGKKVKAPASAWQQVQNELNADFVHQYQHRQSRYKWVAVAAILLAFISFAFQYQPIYSDGKSDAEGYTGATYNALLSEKTAFPGIYGYTTGTLSATYPLREVLVIDRGETNDGAAPEQIAPATMGEPNVLDDQRLASLDTRAEEAEVMLEIYPYHQGGAYAVAAASQREVLKEDRLWAGVEAGAGNFNSSLSTTSAFTNTVNQTNLASALGNDGFVNPSTEINSEISDGIATSIGLDLGLRLGSRWTFETGIAYTNVDSRGDASINVLDVYAVDNAEFFGSPADTDLPVLSTTSRQTTTEVQDSYDYDVDLRSSVRFTSVPLKAGYFIMDRKMSLRLNVGLAANYFIGSQVRGSDNVVAGSINDSYNLWSFDGLGGVEIGYSIFDRFDVTLEPNYRQSITPISDANASMSRFLIQTGLRYKIQ